MLRKSKDVAKDYTKDLHARCRWCGVRKATKAMYKLRDGPMDWWFCVDDHALEWLDYRHATPTVHAMLRLPPTQRVLGNKTIDVWVRDELSHDKVECAHSQS